MTDGAFRRPFVVTTVVAALVAALLAVVDPGAGADTREERDRIRRERAAAAKELDVLRAEDAEVDAALRAMNAEVVAQENDLAVAEAAVVRAEQEVAAALAAEAAMVDKVAVLEALLTDMAVQEFITGGRLRLELLSPQSDDLGEWARRNALADFALGSAAETGDALSEAQEDLVLARQRAEAASVEVAQHRDAVAATLTSVTAARDEQTAFATRLNERIESRLSEAAVLASRDKELSDRLAAEQAALAARNAAGRVSGGPATPVQIPGGRGSLRSVRGITVHESIADELAALLNQASADGIDLSGWGYRDPQDQWRLRQAHCPDPASSPAASCRPPTARPGHSMHERGLAVDFTQHGRTLSRSSSGYRWLRINAASYGFYNLPGEPWHWSTNGN